MTTTTATPEQMARQRACYGCTTAELEAAVAQACGGPIATTPAQMALSILSDAQEMVAMAAPEAARKAINRAKFIIGTYCADSEGVL